MSTRMIVLAVTLLIPLLIILLYYIALLVNTVENTPLEHLTNTSSTTNVLNTSVSGGGLNTITNISRIRVIDSYAVKTRYGWNIYITVENIGNESDTLTTIYIDNETHEDILVRIEPGENRTITLFLPEKLYFSGQLLHMYIEDRYGDKYPLSVALP